MSGQRQNNRTQMGDKAIHKRDKLNTWILPTSRSTGLAFPNHTRTLPKTMQTFQRHPLTPRQLLQELDHFPHQQSLITTGIIIQIMHPWLGQPQHNQITDGDRMIHKRGQFNTTKPHIFHNTEWAIFNHILIHPGAVLIFRWHRSTPRQP